MVGRRRSAARVWGVTTASPKKSDLGVRTVSAIVMVALAGTALWLGGWWWTVFVVAIGLGVLWEWSALARGIATTRTGAAVGADPRCL